MRQLTELTANFRNSLPFSSGSLSGEHIYKENEHV